MERTSASENKVKKGNNNGSPRFGAPFFFTFVLMFTGWIIISGKFDLFHLTLGVVSCLIISFFSSDLLFASTDLKKMAVQWPLFAMYIPWLLYQVFLANIHVMYLVFHPRMMDLIDPGIIRFKSQLKSDMSRTTFANSITLTPGTITVYVTNYGDFKVHVIDKPSGDALPGDMEKRIARIFDE
ncbi:MAG: Na+/H+ antiporter subunit E [Proteobacteria bacterium]|nr:Na+/H+ antiporter subunit E [Pseudomonadota bacterium]